MRLHELTSTHPRPKAKRLGRGNGSGKGNTSGRGNKGQKARSGANSNIPRTFIGGATPLIQRLPKLKGFKTRAIKPVTLNLARIQAVYKADETVTLLSLLEKGLISTKEALQGIKIVGVAGQEKHGLKFEEGNPKITLSKRLAGK